MIVTGAGRAAGSVRTTDGTGGVHGGGILRSAGRRTRQSRAPVRGARVIRLSCISFPNQQWPAEAERCALCSARADHCETDRYAAPFEQCVGSGRGPTRAVTAATTAAPHNAGTGPGGLAHRTVPAGRGSAADCAQIAGIRAGSRSNFAAKRCSTSSSCEPCTRAFCVLTATIGCAGAAACLWCPHKYARGGRICGRGGIDRPL